jgi:hypothetical protein
MRTITLRELISLRLQGATKPLRQWYWMRKESHYNMSADTEALRAREHHINESYYRKQAALARSQRIGSR